jgi:hypothetical protein
MSPKKKRAKAAESEQLAAAEPVNPALAQEADARLAEVEDRTENPSGKRVRVVNLETGAVSTMDFYRAREHVTAPQPKYAYAPAEAE